MIKNDFAWASANRARILAEWTRRYEGKAVKKNYLLSSDRAHQSAEVTPRDARSYAHMNALDHERAGMRAVQ